MILMRDQIVGTLFTKREILDDKIQNLFMGNWKNKLKKRKTHNYIKPSELEEDKSDGGDQYKTHHLLIT